MQVLITIALIIIGVLLFEFIIFAHEFGHFITAKKSGVQVNEFALGMGPKLFSFVKGETRYSLRLFPIGGYCAMEGEDQDSDNPRAFNNAKVWKRMIIIVAGAVMNILVGFLLMLIVTAFQTEFIDTTISGFAPYAYTANAGLREGDKVVSVGGYPVANSRDLALGIQLLPCEEVDPQSVTVFKQDCCTDATNYIYTMRDELKLIDDEIASTLYYQVLPPGAKQINAATSKEEAYNLFKGIIDSYYTAAKAEKPKDFSYPEIEVRDKRLRYTGDVSVIRDGEKQELKGVQFYTYKSGEDKTAVGIDFYLLPKEKEFRHRDGGDLHRHRQPCQERVEVSGAAGARTLPPHGHVGSRRHHQSGFRCGGCRLADRLRRRSAQHRDDHGADHRQPRHRQYAAVPGARRRPLCVPGDRGDHAPPPAAQGGIYRQRHRLGAVDLVDRICFL